MVKSGERELLQVATHKWKVNAAENRMQRLIREQNYGPLENVNTPLHAVLSPNDSLATYIIRALLEDGKYDKTNIPLVTGMDCSKSAVQNIYKGFQGMCVFKDLRILAQNAANVIYKIEQHKIDESYDEDISFNGIKKVPTFLSEAVIVYADNLKEVLIDSGYLTLPEITAHE